MLDPKTALTLGEEVDKLRADRAALREMLLAIWPTMSAFYDITVVHGAMFGVTSDGKNMIKGLLTNMEEVLRETK